MSFETYRITVTRCDGDGALLDRATVVLREEELSASKAWTTIVEHRVVELFRMLRAPAD